MRYSIKKFDENDGFRYRVIDASGNWLDYAQANVIDDHFVLECNDGIGSKVFGVVDIHNKEEAMNKAEIKANELLIQRLKDDSIPCHLKTP